MTRLASAASFDDRRTSGHTPHSEITRISSCAWESVMALCSMSTVSQSNPALAMISAEDVSAKVTQLPTTTCPAASFRRMPDVSTTYPRSAYRRYTGSESSSRSTRGTSAGTSTPTV